MNIKKLSDITDITLGQSPPSSSYNTNKDGLPFFQGKAEFGKLYPTPIKYCSEPKKRALKGDVLISVRAPVGDVNLSPGECVIGRGLASIRPNKDYILLNILLYFLQYKKNYFIGKSTGTTFQAISGDVIKNCEINLPPLPTQKKIASKIDTLFAKIDSGTQSLEKAKRLLEKYRQSVLKHAFEGKLTAKWREENKDKRELPSVLLERIKEERKKKLGKKYKELPPVDASKLPELPEGWMWCRAETICEKIQDGTHFSPKTQHEKKVKNAYLYITAKNIRDWGMDLKKVTYVDEIFHKEIFKRCDPKYGDVLLVKDGVGCGTITLNTLNEEFSLLSSVAFLRPYSSIVENSFLKFYLKSPMGFRSITGNMTGTAIKRIILRKIKETYIPVPSIDEQKLISNIVYSETTKISKLDDQLKKYFSTKMSLKNSILKSAFEGKLIHD